jgi:FixJ family two-component response regulator
MQALRDPSSITDRQRQVIQLIAEGLSNEELGHALGISPRTAKAHRLLTGDAPLAKSLASARADNGG